MPLPMVGPDGARLQKPLELVGIATSRDASRVQAWRNALSGFGIPSRIQTVTARSRGRAPQVAYLLYVDPADEDHAVRLVGGTLDGPIFPLAHLRHTDGEVSGATVGDET